MVGLKDASRHRLETGPLEQYELDFKSAVGGLLGASVQVLVLCTLPLGGAQFPDALAGSPQMVREVEVLWESIRDLLHPHLAANHLSVAPIDTIKMVDHLQAHLENLRRDL